MLWVYRTQGCLCMLLSPCKTVFVAVLACSTGSQNVGSSSDGEEEVKPLLFAGNVVLLAPFQEGECDLFILFLFSQ